MIMAPRVSIKDVRTAWKNYCDVAQAAGFDTTGWHLQEGSAVQGVHYSGRTGTGSAVPGAIGYGMNSAYLGTTQGETYDALRHLTAALQAVVDLHRATAEQAAHNAPYVMNRGAW
jgi:hypothetical protein